MLDVVILEIMPELPYEKFAELLSLVAKEKQVRIKKFHFFQDARNCLLGDVLSRLEISRAFGLYHHQLEFSTNQFGKPHLTSFPKCFYNISHTGNYIACALSNAPVGIDIEVMQPVDLKIAERFFSPDEISYIVAGNKLTRFYEIWTKKESRIKLEGKGLHIPLASFSVFDANEQGRVYYHKVFENTEVVCHTCSLNSTVPTIRMIDSVELMQNIGKL
ncbi:MAG: 4'-phosphopantetheinyl transferase superfamily protein [Defluviitaleaceae bacterium]|nr:4'-phosphopantetheinyl transferase superfamily protein [Defluviitaleaceae bacterium]